METRQHLKRFSRVGPTLERIMNVQKMLACVRSEVPESPQDVPGSSLLSSALMGALLSGSCAPWGLGGIVSLVGRHGDRA